MVIREHRLALHVTNLWLLAVLLLAGSNPLIQAKAEEPPSDLTSAQREKLEKDASQLAKDGDRLYGQGKLSEAAACWQRVLAIHEQLYPLAQYPAGHPDLAQSLNNLGFLLKAKGEYEQALTYYRRALAMRQRLYPESQYPAGHPDLAQSLNNLGGLLQAQGEYEQALAYYRRALAMYQRLYPPAQYPAGHPDLAASLANLGGLLQAQGDYDQALDYGARALVMGRKFIAREIATAPEAQALRLLLAQPRRRDGYLSASLQRPGAAAASYEHVWLDKAAVMRLQQRRHEAALVARQSSADIRRQYDQLITLRQQVNRLLVHPGKDVHARDRRLAELTDEQEKVERELAAVLPQLPRRHQLDQATAKDLAANLQARASLVDFIHYRHYEDGKASGFCYLAFVVAPDRVVQRIDLGKAGPIDAAITSWRQSIARGEASQAPQRLRQLVWQPIARALPADTRTVYLCPDGDLARLPQRGRLVVAGQRCRDGGVDGPVLPRAVGEEATAAGGVARGAADDLPPPRAGRGLGRGARPAGTGEGGQARRWPGGAAGGEGAGGACADQAVGRLRTVRRGALNHATSGDHPEGFPAHEFFKRGDP